LTGRILFGKILTTTQESKQMASKIHQVVSTDTAVQIIRQFVADTAKGKTVKARHYIRTNNTSSGVTTTPPIVGLDVTLREEQWEALIAYADKIIFWHYDFKPECGRDIDIHIGNANYSIPVA
jgi:hypothetical protein